MFLLLCFTVLPQTSDHYTLTVLLVRMVGVAISEIKQIRPALINMVRVYLFQFLLNLNQFMLVLVWTTF